jgi:hypothetical protein
MWLVCRWLILVTWKNHIQEKCYVTIIDISDLHEIWKIVHQWEDRILPTCLDKGLEPVGAPKIEQFNMRLWRRRAPRRVGERNVTWYEQYVH